MRVWAGVGGGGVNAIARPQLAFYIKSAVVPVLGICVCEASRDRETRFIAWKNRNEGRHLDAQSTTEHDSPSSNRRVGIKRDARIPGTNRRYVEADLGAAPCLPTK